MIVNFKIGVFGNVNINVNFKIGLLRLYVITSYTTGEFLIVLNRGKLFPAVLNKHKVTQIS